MYAKRDSRSSQARSNPGALTANRPYLRAVSAATCAACDAQRGKPLRRREGRTVPILSLRHVNHCLALPVPLAVAIVVLGAWTEAAAEWAARAWERVGAWRMKDET